VHVLGVPEVRPVDLGVAQEAPRALDDRHVADGADVGRQEPEDGEAAEPEEARGERGGEGGRGPGDGRVREGKGGCGELAEGEVFDDADGGG